MQSNHHPITLAVLSGVITAGIFLVVFASGLGFIFMFLPTLPLFALGLSRYAQTTSLAVWLAFALIALLAGMDSALVFMGFLGLPAWYLAKGSLIHIPLGKDKAALWMPLGQLLTRMTLCACAVIALTTLYYAFQPGGLPRLLAQNIHAAFADLEGDYGEVIDTLAIRLSFLVFATTIWLWGLALYAHAWLAHRALSVQNQQVRPDFFITPFPIPSWMLTLLVICALASLIGGTSLSFLGKSTLISLMLPYFFLGAAQLQTTSKTWPNRRFFLFFIYFMVAAQIWPALIISGMGLWHQIKHLSAGGSWFKS